MSKKIGLCLLLVIAFFTIIPSAFCYENLDSFASNRAANINNNLQANYLQTSLTNIENWYVDQQVTWIQIPMPGTNRWTQGSSPTHVPIDWDALGSTFTSQLSAKTEFGINVFPLLIKENFTTHQVEYWVDDTLIHTMSFRPNYDWTTNTPSGGDTNMYNPARIIIEATLVKDNEMYTYLYNESFQLGAMLSEAGEENEALEDVDGDGVPNITELRFGTDPYDSGDFPYLDIATTESGVEIEWAAPTNRWYQMQSATGSTGLLSGSFTAEGSSRMGNATILTHTDNSGDTTKYFRNKISEADVNSNDLPDWWEYKYWGSLTTNTPSGDNDGDGLDNGEELYFGYSPLVSERDLIHSIYHTVIVATDTPSPDSGEERFDFHGGGRILGLASGASDGFGVIQGDSHSGGIFFNNDEDNLYIGVSGLNVAGDNAFVIFVDAKAGGVTNLSHLSGQPYAFGRADNFTFNTNSFLPEVGIILGANYADGKNYTSFSIGNKNFGQGVYNLMDLSHFSGFSTTQGAISQWAKNAGGAEVSPRAGCEIELSLTALGAQPGDTIKVAACFIGGTDNTDRWASSEAYGKSVSGDGFNTITLVGADVHLAGAEQTLPTAGYPGFDEDDVMIQLFFWNAGSPGENPTQQGDTNWYNNVATQAVDLAASGFTLGYLPPPQKSESGRYSMGYDPYDQRDLGEYDQKSTIPTRFGDLAALTNLTAVLTANGLKTTVDIVINHMRQVSGQTFDYVHNTFEKTAADFHPSTQGHNDEMLPYHKTSEFGSDYYDIDHLAPYMRLGLKQWGDWVTGKVGFQAYRFDLSQRIESWYIWEWMHYRRMLGSFAVMEYWALADGRELQEWIDLTGRVAAVFDWNLQKMLKDMCESNGSFDMKTLDHPSLLGMEPDYTVTFVDSHDTYAPMKTLDELGIAQDKKLAYAYILFQLGLPMIYYHDHFLAPYHDGTPDPNDSTRGWPSGYFGQPLKPHIDKGIWIRQNFLSGEPEYLVTDSAVQSDLFIAVRSGNGTKPGGMLVLNDATGTRTTTVSTPWLDTTLRDAYSNNASTEVTTEVDGSVTLTAIPARSFRVYVPASYLP